MTIRNEFFTEGNNQVKLLGAKKPEPCREITRDKP